jgi:hypothetical protein
MTIQANFPAIKPSLMLDFANTKQLDSRITYTRASTASYYDGVTTSKAEENLVTYSEQLDNAAWAKSASTITANSTTAPDGTSTADSFVENVDTNQYHQVSQQFSAVSGTTYTFSSYLKQNSRTKAGLLLGSGTADVHFIFDLSAGTVGSAVYGAGGGWSSATATITSVGSSWYRCVITATATATITRTALIELNNGTSRQYNGDGSSIFVWGAQLEIRSSATAYTATTTQAITNYIPKLQTAASGVARFDNNPTTGESLGLLIEESRTNLLTYSSQFDDASWTKSATTITPNIVVAPDGTLTGDLLLETATTAGHYIQQTVNVTNGTVYTASCYIKPNGRTTIEFYMGFVFNIKFDLTGNGSVTAVTGGTGGTITSVGNGWFRITATGTASSTSATIFALYGIPDSGYAGDSFKGWFIWGAQFEAGSFATSYIPTVASQVTRAADAASMTGTNFSTWFNQAEGTIYSEAAAYAIGSRGIFDFTDGTNNNQMAAFAGSGSSGQRHLNVRVSGSTVATLDGGSYADGAYSKQATVLKANDFALSLAGATAVTTSSGSVPIVNQMLIGNSTTSASVLNGTIKKIAFYPLRVTNAQLQALTS